MQLIKVINESCLSMQWDPKKTSDDIVSQIKSICPGDKEAIMKGVCSPNTQEDYEKIARILSGNNIKFTSYNPRMHKTGGN
jgi:hypothetical protein